VSYIFNTEHDQQQMFERIGVSSIAELFQQVPADLQLDRPLKMPPAESELALHAELQQRAALNHGSTNRTCFMGGGAYDHFVPAVVDEIAARGEFYTAYTPYQAEASQGSLQAFFEFQSMICEITGMDVSNASLYEGGTSVSEGAFMAMRVTRRHNKVAVLESVHPEYRQILETYLTQLDGEVITVPTPNGVADTETVDSCLDDQTACLITQSPNFFGCLEELEALSDAAHRYGALSLVSTNPVSLGLLKSPGACGADIVTAEGQPLGIPLQYGGPYLGILACREEYVRKMPGRLVGETRDRNGKKCYVLNLQAREQHIRRDKSTSNICTNQGLLALRATVYLAALGPAGLQEVAELCCQKAHYAADQLSQVDGIALMWEHPFFNEFVVRCDKSVDQVISAAGEAGFDIGPALNRFSQLLPTSGAALDLDNCLLVAVTECRTQSEIDQLCAVIGA